MWFPSMGLRQGSALCSSSSRKYPGTLYTNQKRHWNHHRRHATNSLERTRLSCGCLHNHKGCTYRASVRYVTKTWSVVLLNKKDIHSYLKCVVYDKLLKLRQSFWITLCVHVCVYTHTHTHIYIYIYIYERRNGDNHRVSIMYMSSIPSCYDSQGIHLPDWLFNMERAFPFNF